MPHTDRECIREHQSGPSFQNRSIGMRKNNLKKKKTHKKEWMDKRGFSQWNWLKSRINEIMKKCFSFKCLTEDIASYC